MSTMLRPVGVPGIGVLKGVDVEGRDGDTAAGRKSFALPSPSPFDPVLNGFVFESTGIGTGTGLSSFSDFGGRSWFSMLGSDSLFIKLPRIFFSMLAMADAKSRWKDSIVRPEREIKYFIGYSKIFLRSLVRGNSFNPDQT